MFTASHLFLGQTRVDLNRMTGEVLELRERSDTQIRGGGSGYVLVSSTTSIV